MIGPFELAVSEKGMCGVIHSLLRSLCLHLFRVTCNLEEAEQSLACRWHRKVAWP